MSKFIKPKNGVVYHCIPVEPVGDVIRPSDNYGAHIPDDVRQKLKMPDGERTPLIFGATHITKAMAFGLQAGLNEKILNGSIEGSDSEFVLACDRNKMMTRNRDITIYEVPDKDFVKLEYAERQCVARDAIPFANTKIAFKAKNAEDLMRGGLQILAFNESMQALYKNKVLDKIDDARKNNRLFPLLGKFLKEGILVWENKDRSIKSCPALATLLDIHLAAPASNAVKRSSNKPSR